MGGDLSRLELVVLKGISLKMNPDKIAETIGNVDPNTVWRITDDLKVKGYITKEGKLTSKGFDTLAEIDVSLQSDRFSEARKYKREYQENYKPKYRFRARKALLILVPILIITAIVLPILPEVFTGLGIESQIIEPLSIDVEDIRISGIGFRGLHGRVVLSVYNPNPFPAHFDRIDFRICSKDGSLIASGSVPYTHTISPNSVKDIYCGFDIPWTGGGKLIFEKLKGLFTNQRVPLKVTGTVYVDVKLTRIPIPFSKTVYV